MLPVNFRSLLRAGARKGWDLPQKFPAGGAQICNKRPQFAPKCPDWRALKVTAKVLPDRVSSSLGNLACTVFRHHDMTHQSKSQVMSWDVKL